MAPIDKSRMCYTSPRLCSGVESPGKSRGVVRFASFELDLDAGELKKHGVKLRLPEQSFQILALLLERPGQVVTRDALRQKLWTADTFVDFDVGLNNAILRLRHALGDSAETPRFVETLPRRGYRFIAPVDHGAPAAAHASPAPSPRSATAEAATLPVGKPSVGPAAPSKPQLPLRSLWFAGLALAALIVMLVGFNATGLRQRLLGRSHPPRIQSIAVLPLENLTGDPSQEYFVDGMTDALITNLAQIGSLQVISRTSVLRYKGEKKSLPAIARELGVDAVVEGTVARSGNRVRIDAQLVHAATDRHLWAHSYERDLSDAMALQSEMAQAIAAEIRAKLTPQEQARLGKTQRVNPAAYEAYLKGRFLLNRWSVEEANKALQYFQQALAINPNYAQAYSGLSDSYRTLALFSGPKPEAWQKARAAATRALELDDSLAEAHRSLASVRGWYDWDLPGGERELQRALQLNSGDAETYRQYGLSLLYMGRLNEAMAMTKRAQELDPLSPAVAVEVARNYYFARRYDQAIEQARKAIELDPTFVQAHRLLGYAYEAEGKFPEAIAEFKLAVKLSPGNLSYLGILGRGYAVAGNRREARRTIAKLKELSKTRYVEPLQFALIYAALGEKDQAFAWLEKAFEERNGNLIALSVAPWFDPLRSDPRFADLVRRVGLAEDSSSR